MCCFLHANSARNVSHIFFKLNLLKVPLSKRAFYVVLFVCCSGGMRFGPQTARIQVRTQAA